MLRLLVLFLLTVASSFAQSPFQCAAVPAEPPFLRVESLAERVGDLRFSCTGVFTGVNPTFVVSLNAPIASPLTGASLLVGEPPVAFTPTLSSPNQLTFANVVLPSATAFPLRFTGIRADLQSFTSALAAEPPAIKATVSAGNITLRNPEVIVGYATPSLLFEFYSATGSFPISRFLLEPSPSGITHKLVFRETLLNSFRLQSSEPGATQSTRLVAHFSNLPPGTAISAYATSLAGNAVSLTTSESGPYNPSTQLPNAYVPLTIVNNSAIAVWEVLYADPSVLESVTVGIIASGSAVVGPTVGARYGPFDTTSIPRFAPTYAPPPATNCSSSCVFLPSAISYTHRYGDPRPPPQLFPVSFYNSPLMMNIVPFTDSSVPWFSSTNTVMQWAPEMLPPGQYTGILSVRPMTIPTALPQYLYLTLTVLPALNRQAAPPLCDLSAGVPPNTRAEGLAEPVSQVTFNCTGTPGTVVSSDLSLRFNAPVRSAILTSTTPAPVEALLISDLPGSPEFPGTVHPPYLINFPVSLTIPGSGQFTLTTANIRLDTNSLGLGSGTNPTSPEVRAQFYPPSPALLQPKQTIGYNTPGYSFSQTPSTLPVVSDPGLTLPVNLSAQLTFTEGFATSFKKRNLGTTFSSPLTLQDQADYTNNFFTETLVYAASRGPQGLATQGTRLRVVFSGVPSGAVLYVTNGKLSSSSGAIEAKRINVLSNGAGGFVETPSTATIVDGGTSYPASVVPVQNGTGVAVWEILASSPFSLETIRFGAAAKGASSGAITQITASLAPLDDNLSRPRFSELLPVSECPWVDCLTLPPALHIRRSVGGNLTYRFAQDFKHSGALVRYVAESQAPWLIIGERVGYLPSSLVLIIHPSATNYAPGVYTGSITVNGQSIPSFYYVDGGPDASVDETRPQFYSGASATIEIESTHRQGFAQLDVVNALINTSLDGANACYIAYSRSLNVLYLVNNAGVASGLSAPLTLGSGGQVSNGQCTVFGNGSSVSALANTVRLRLNISFQPSFTGNRVLYLAARGVSGENSGWQTKGAIVVPGAAAVNPQVSPALPSAGTNLTDSINFAYSSTAPLETVWGLINTAVDARNACYFAYHVPSGSLFLFPDNGDGAQATTMPLAGSGTIENSQCRLAATGSTATVSGNNLSLTLKTTFKPTFLGGKGIWGAAKTLDAAPASPWRVIGAWQAPLF